MLSVLQRRAEKAGVAGCIQAFQCEANSMGINEPTDFVLAFYSAHEVPDLRRLLSEIHGCLRSGGRLLVAEPIGHVTATDFQKMLSLAGEIGLSVEERPRIRLSRAAVLVAQ
jgi:ubiquinone/menaquinone biosynthesis C-methylase UbiE